MILFLNLEMNYPAASRGVSNKDIRISTQQAAGYQTLKQNELTNILDSISWGNSTLY